MELTVLACKQMQDDIGDRVCVWQAGAEGGEKRGQKENKFTMPAQLPKKCENLYKPISSNNRHD